MKAFSIATCFSAALGLGPWVSQASAQPAAPPAAAEQKQQPSAQQERVAELKQAMAQSQRNLRAYEWVETTVVLMKDEEKSRKQERCYYGADGKLQKLAVDATPEPEKKRGLRGRVAEKKKEELTGYMKSAVQQVKEYVPPEPALIQKCKDNGKVSIDVLEPGRRIRMGFADYHVPGDSFKIEIDLITNRPTSATVATFINDEEKGTQDPVSLAVRFGTLPDGTIYAEQVSLAAPAKKLDVQISNSGYRKLGGAAAP